MLICFSNSLKTKRLKATKYPYNKTNLWNRIHTALVKQPFLVGNKDWIYIDSPKRTHYMFECDLLNLAVLFRGNWISFINSISGDFWGWQRRILSQSRLVYAFHSTTWSNDVKNHRGAVQFPDKFELIFCRHVRRIKSNTHKHKTRY